MDHATADRARARLAQLVSESGTDFKTLSLKIGKNHAYLQQYVTRGTPRALPEEVRAKLASHLGVTESELKTGVPGPRGETYGELAPLQMETIPELDIRAHGGGGGIADDAQPIATWGFPPEVMRYDLRASFEDLVIMAVEGDSMEPTIRAGDRVVVNKALRSPSPPGLFVLHNGIGVVAKRIDMVPRSDPPRILVMSDNERYRPYEATAEEVNILGRIVLRLERV